MSTNLWEKFKNLHPITQNRLFTPEKAVFKFLRPHNQDETSKSKLEFSKNKCEKWFFKHETSKSKHETRQSKCETRCFILYLLFIKLHIRKIKLHLRHIKLNLKCGISLFIYDRQRFTCGRSPVIYRTSPVTYGISRFIYLNVSLLCCNLKLTTKVSKFAKLKDKTG